MLDLSRAYHDLALDPKKLSKLGQSLSLSVDKGRISCGCKHHVFVDFPSALQHLMKKSVFLAGAVIEGGRRQAFIRDRVDTRSQAEKECFGLIYPSDLPPEYEPYKLTHRCFLVRFAETETPRIVPQDNQTRLVNFTKICPAGVNVCQFLGSASCKELLDSLPLNQESVTIKTGPNCMRGTYFHAEVALLLACRLFPKLAVFVIRISADLLINDPHSVAVLAQRLTRTADAVDDAVSRVREQQCKALRAEANEARALCRQLAGAEKLVADARDWVAGNKHALDKGASLLELAEKEVVELRRQLSAAREEARPSATASLTAAGPSSSTGILASVARHTLELEREILRERAQADRERAQAVADAEERTLAVHNKTIEVETARMKAADAAAATATAQARLVDARVEELRETLRVQQLEHQKATAVARAEEQRTIQRQDEQANQLAIREMEARGRHECCMARARFFREQSQQGRSGTDTPPPNGDEYTFCSKAMVDEVVDIVTVTPVSPLPGQSIPSDNVVDGFVPTGFVLDERATQRMGRELTHTERIIFETELRSLYLRAGIPFPEPMRQMEGGPSRYMCYTHHMYLFDEAVSRMPWMWHSAPAAAAPAAPAPPAAPVPSAPVASVAATPSAAAGSADGTVGRDAPAAPEQGREKRVKLE
eukprot:jgi/Mesvir1/9139/Mv14389-RA.1